jgi:glycerol-3-phosphate dehydrogenase
LRIIVFLWLSVTPCRYKLVKEALRERSSFISVAPHLTAWMPIMIPIQKWWEAPYDLLSGFAKNSYYMSKTATLQAFPNLDKSQVLGSLVYYGNSAVPFDNDSETNLSCRWSSQRFSYECVTRHDRSCIWRNHSQLC